MKKIYQEYWKTISGKPIGMNGLRCEEGESFASRDMISEQESYQDQITGESTRIVRLKNGSVLRFSMSEDRERAPDSCRSWRGISG